MTILCIFFGHHATYDSKIIENAENRKYGTNNKGTEGSEINESGEHLPAQD